jgi:hypothetical protein
MNHTLYSDAGKDVDGAADDEEGNDANDVVGPELTKSF